MHSDLIKSILNVDVDSNEYQSSYGLYHSTTLMMCGHIFAIFHALSDMIVSAFRTANHSITTNIRLHSGTTF